MKRRLDLLPGLAVIVLIVLVRLTGNLQYLERIAFDYLLRLRPAEPTDERILIVGIDEEDIRRAKTYPIPDRDLAALIQTLQQQQPAVIGLDIFRDLPVEPGHADLVKAFAASQPDKNLIGIERVLGGENSKVNPPRNLPSDQVGFVDARLDSDGRLRRSLLGDHDYQGDYKFSFTIRLAQHYLKQQGLSLENGIRDPINMRFGSTELQHLRPDSGGYVGENTQGNQILINFRGGSQPFRVVPMRDVLSGSVPTDRIRDRIVLIGVTSPSIGDIFYTNAISNNNFIFGVEIQAHAISQIVSAVLDDRPLIQSWSEGWEYIWIVSWGVLAIVLNRVLRSPFKVLVAVVLSSIALIGICYVFLTVGYWVPLVPSLLAVLAVAVAIQGYRYEQGLKLQITERQEIIDRIFDAIHSGPLQILATIRRNINEGNTSVHLLQNELGQLEEEVRAIYDFMQQQFIFEGDTFYLNRKLKLDLETPTSELLHQIFYNTLTRNFPGFKSIKVKVLSFSHIDSCVLTPEQKQGLCVFLEGALCNVGKHAIGATQLQVLYHIEDGNNIFQIIDDGQTIAETSNTAKPEKRSKNLAKNRGTQQAKSIERLFKGKFQRRLNEPHGMICELIWSDKKPRFRFF